MRSRSRSAERRDWDSLRCEPRWAKTGLSKEHTAGPGADCSFHESTREQPPGVPRPRPLAKSSAFRPLSY
jgi:hypothetical protein